MEMTQSNSSSTVASTTGRTSTCGSGTRKRRTTWQGIMSKGYLSVGVVVLLIALQLSSPVWSASLNKRSIDQSEEVCRSNAICGWEVYHPSTRNLQYYVASSCKCSPKETCIRAEDDISISAYVFRCRDSRKRKTTRRPSTDPNETS